jgi:hypothetical protein
MAIAVGNEWELANGITKAGVEYSVFPYVCNYVDTVYKRNSSECYEVNAYVLNESRYLILNPCQ